MSVVSRKVRVLSLPTSAPYPSPVVRTDVIDATADTSANGVAVQCDSVEHGPSIVVSERTSDLMVAGVCLLVAVVVLVATSDLEYWGGFGPSAGFLPRWLAILLLGAAAALGASALASHRTDIPAMVSWATHGRAVLGIGLFAVFIALMALIGFVPAFVVVFAVLLRVLDRCRPVTAVLVPIAIAGVLYAIFDAGLMLNLPPGVLFESLWR